MKYNNENLRKIIMKMVETPFGATITVANLQELIPEISMEEMISTITMLNRERFITIAGKPSYDDDDVFRDNKIKCLTERGYCCYDLISDDDVWNLIKEKIPNYNDLSLFMILSIASKIINKKQNEEFDLPRDIYIDYSRW